MIIYIREKERDIYIYIYINVVGISSGEIIGITKSNNNYNRLIIHYYCYFMYMPCMYLQINKCKHGERNNKLLRMIQRSKFTE